jgi:hypothetical protein
VDGGCGAKRRLRQSPEVRGIDFSVFNKKAIVYGVTQLDVIIIHLHHHHPPAACLIYLRLKNPLPARKVKVQPPSQVRPGAAKSSYDAAAHREMRRDTDR